MKVRQSWFLRAVAAGSGALLAGIAPHCAAAAPSRQIPMKASRHGEPLHEVPFRQIDLSAAMPLPPGWVLRAERPGGGMDPTIGDMPARICFDAPAGGGEPQGSCTALNWTAAGINAMTYPLQTIDDIAITPIPDGADGTRSAVLVRASYSGGAHGLHVLLAWRFSPGLGFSPSPEAHAVDDGGEQRYVTTGPLAGLFVQTSQRWTTQKTMADPEHVDIELSRVTKVGSYRVLSLLSPETYDTPARDGPPPHLIDALTPWIVQMLHAAYPKGLP